MFFEISRVISILYDTLTLYRVRYIIDDMMKKKGKRALYIGIKMFSCIVIPPDFV